MLRIKELREGRRLSQEGLAMKLNTSQSTISDFETGERTPDLEHLRAFAKFFDVSLDYLVGLSDIKRPIQQSDLSADELECLHRYRRADKVQREKIKAYMDGMLG